MLTRRTIVLGLSTLGLGLGANLVLGIPAALAESEGTFEITRSKEEWRRLLTPVQFDILRNHATESPGSSPLLDEHRPGTFHCAGCDLPLFSSETKYDSRTGWPSFWKPIDDAVGTRKDFAFFMIRTEVHCRRCGGHLGHIFEDGPQPTGLRYCINGYALTFRRA